MAKKKTAHHPMTAPKIRRIDDDPRSPLEKVVGFAEGMGRILEEHKEHLERLDPRLHKHLAEILRTRGRATKAPLGTGAALVALADQAHLGQTYARAAVLARHFGELASSLPLSGPGSIDPALVAYVDAAWNEFRHKRLGEPRTPREHRANFLMSLDVLDADGISFADLLGDNTSLPDGEGDLAVFLRELSLLRRIQQAWPNEDPGRTEDSKWALLEELSKGESHEASAKTWANEASELRKAGLLRPTKK